MPTEKCIPIKKKLIVYMSEQLPDFPFEGGETATFTPFAVKILMESMTIS